MLSVAGFALLLGVGIHLAGLGDRAGRFQALANDYSNRASQTRWLAGESAKSAKLARDAADEEDKLAQGCRSRGDAAGAEQHGRNAGDRLATVRRLDEAAEKLNRKAAWLNERGMKYRAAKDHPIWPVWPDPAD